MSRKTIFVTGAASGIGRETARLFARRGFAVGAYDRDAAGLEDLAAELGPGHCHGVLDVTDPEAFAHAVAAFDHALGGRMDVLFNCAGVMRMGRFDQLTLRDHLLTIQVNITGVVVGTHCAMALLKRTPGAHVVSMCSASAVYGVPELSTYSASKFFVKGFTEALEIELASHGIVVTDLMPTYVSTPMITGQAHHAGTLRTMGAGLLPEQIAELVFKAAHGRRVHWMPGLHWRFLAWAGAAFPPFQRPMMRLLARL